VLDACSDYFASFLNNKSLEDKNLVICLPTEIKLWEVEAILAFMYNGSVAISQEGLSSLVKVAEMLQVKGLCESSSITANGQNSPREKNDEEILAENSTSNENIDMNDTEEVNENEQCGYNDQMIIKREIDISDVDDQESQTRRISSPKASGLIRVKQNLFENAKKSSTAESLVYNKKSMDIYVKGKPQTEPTPTRCITPKMTENNQQQFEDIVCSPTLMQYDDEQNLNFDDDDDFIIEETGNEELYNIISQKFEKCEQFSINDSEQSSKLLISSVSSQFNQSFRGEEMSNGEMKSAIGGLYLRNPRGNQERKYDVNALYSALQDVKNGHSIYR
jgi:BTB/POZ domain